MIKIKLEEPGAPPLPLEFDQSTVTIGRSNDCALPVQDPKASRQHCQIIQTGHGFNLIDLGSSNGTLINGATCQGRHPLNPGDRIEIGKTVIIFKGDGKDGSSRLAAAGGVRMSSAKIPVAPRSHLVPFLTFAAILALFLGVIYIFLLRPEDELGPQEGTSTLLSAKGEEGGQEWKDFAEQDAKRREEQRRREERIVREAEARREAEKRQADQYAADNERRDREVKEAETKKAAAERVADEAKRKAEAEARAKRRTAEAGQFAEEKKTFLDMAPVLSSLLRKFKFDVAQERIQEFQSAVKTEAGLELAVMRSDEIGAMASAFEKMWKNLDSGDEISVRGRTVRIRKADAEGIRGQIGMGSTTQKWINVPPEDLVPLFDWTGMTAEDRYGVGLLCFEMGLQEEGESQLAQCVQLDPGQKLLLDLLVARVRGIDPPAGGFLIYLDMWITAEEKALVDKGYRRYKGKWMTEAEVNKAKGLVQVGDEWMTPEEKREKEELEKKIDKIRPKGYIDKPGYYDGKPWEKAITIETRNYKIKSNLKREAVEDAGKIMEWMNWNFRQIFRFRKRMQKFEVWIGGTRKDYMDHGGGRGGALGHCTSGGVISTFYQPPITLLVLMHEGTHQFIFRIAPTCPRWMHEGMATFFECSKFKVDLKRKILALRTGLLNRNRLMTIRRSLNNGTAASMDDFINGRKGDPYSQGWAFVYYIVNAHKGMYARHWLSFLKDIGKGKPEKWLKKWMGIRNLAAFEKDWKEFILALDPNKGEDQKIDHK
ncbi:MAG: FHA domain-containing protein [Planctomycetota bacterium]|jgi:pSer/pThr/pTyr-binding forkhead associated (FHA) protein